VKTVLVSGGARGLGAAIVDHFLQLGYRVASFSRGETSQVESWRVAYPENFYFEELSLIDRPACKAYLKRVQEVFGEVDILVNNAGIAHTSVLALTSDEAIDDLIEVNLKGALYLTRLVTRPMLSLGWGRIINISSIVGLSGYRGLSVYSASKAAMDGFTRSLARELGSRSITVNSVAPGYLTTEMTDELNDKQTKKIIDRTPLGRLGTPADVAALVAFVASDQAGFITGQVLVVDGGVSC
jgi:3-oxoacyl-[acyl-carrier protein] reductase